MKVYILAPIAAIALTVIAGIIVIPLLKKLNAGQTILKYVEEHKSKNGTPTMGGLFFIFSAVIIFVIFNGFNGRIAYTCLAIGLSYMVVGALDDFLKIKQKQNLGLKAYQKIIFQLAIGVAAGVFAYINKLTLFYIPFTNVYTSFGVWTIPLIVIIFLAITNSVNLTDGLDGLAGGVSFVYLLLFGLLILLQTTKFATNYLDVSEYNSVILLSFVLCGGILGFLVFNTFKASVFMGDTGSLALGGFIGSISVFTGNSFFIPVIGIMFVMSSISVIIQVIHFKRTGKRVFLMAPLHHHFQHKGHSEGKIAFIYSAITLVMGLASIVFYV